MDPVRPIPPPRLQRRLVTILSASLLAAQAHAAAPHWPDTYVARLQTQALIQTLNAEILSSDSATLSLEKWCRDHQLAAEPRLVATLIQGADRTPTREQRLRLQVGPEEPVKYRRVHLSCGALVLSEADNWYVPGRLTGEMNRLLETTDIPFGRAVLGLAPFRRTYAATVLWSPLPPQWELDKHGGKPPSDAAGRGPLAIPKALFEHKAIVFGRDLRPISEVVETYQRGLLAFPPPR